MLVSLYHSKNLKLKYNTKVAVLKLFINIYHYFNGEKDLTTLKIILTNHSDTMKHSDDG